MRGRRWNEFTEEEQHMFLEKVIGPQKKYGNNKIWIPTIFYSIVSILGIPEEKYFNMVLISVDFLFRLKLTIGQIIPSLRT